MKNEKWVEQGFQGIRASRELSINKWVQHALFVKEICYVIRSASRRGYDMGVSTYFGEIKWVEWTVLGLLECHHLEIHSPRWRILVSDSVVQITDSIVRIRGGNTVEKVRGEEENVRKIGGTKVSRESR